MSRRKPVGVLLTDTHSDKDSWEESSDLFDQAFSLCEELGVMTLFMLGDAFTNRTGQALTVLLSLRDKIKEAEQRGITIHAIAGNHDKTDQESEKSYLDMFEDFPLFHLYKKETSVVVNNLLCHFLPYFPENGSYFIRLQNLIKEAKENGEGYLFTHVAVDGARNNDGSLVSNKLKSVFFKYFKKVFIGHYHDRSQIGDNIFYMGAGGQRNYGEDDEKGFAVLYDDGSHEYVNAVFCKYVKRTADLTKLDVDTVYEIAGELADLKAKHKYKVRLVLVGTDEDFATINMPKIKGMGIDVKQENLRILRSMEAAKSAPNLSITRDTLFQQFIRYCAANKVPPHLRKLGAARVKTL